MGYVALMIWWETPQWLAYEEAYKSAVPRVQELAEATWQTRVIDLSLDEAELWRGVRKSYHAIIHKAERDLSIAEWFAPCACEVARDVHRQAAGRETRSSVTWSLMQDWIALRRGLMVGAERKGVHDSALAFVYVIVWGSWAYYASGASLELNVQHALIWRAMKELKARGVRYFEIGWQGHAQDDKGKAIEFFKTGFGGADMPANEAPTLCGL